MPAGPLLLPGSACFQRPSHPPSTSMTCPKAMTHGRTHGQGAEPALRSRCLTRPPCQAQHGLEGGSRQAAPTAPSLACWPSHRLLLGARTCFLWRPQDSRLPPMCHRGTPHTSTPEAMAPCKGVGLGRCGTSNVLQAQTLPLHAPTCLSPQPFCASSLPAACSQVPVEGGAHQDSSTRGWRGCGVWKSRPGSADWAQAHFHPGPIGPFTTAAESAGHT